MGGGRFSGQGLGIVLANMFNQHFQAHGEFPNIPRGRQLISAADFSGSHANSLYETYAFLLLDLDANQWWLQAQKAFRGEVLKTRRLSFKALNDRVRRDALPAFLTVADEIQGTLVVVAIDKATGTLFERSPRSDLEVWLEGWKPAVREQVLRIAHLGSYLIAGLSAPHQDVLWIVDQDQVAANDEQLTRLTKVVGTIGQNYLRHDAGHLRCATTRSDDGSLAIEDLAAIADLAAGAFAEYLNAQTRQGTFPVRGVISPEPVGLTAKTRFLCRWLISSPGPLKRLFITLDRPPPQATLRASKIKFEPYEPMFDGRQPSWPVG